MHPYHNRRIVDHTGGIVDLSNMYSDDAKEKYRSIYAPGMAGRKPRRKVRNTTDLSQVARIAPEVLELAWIKDPVTLSGCRLYQSLVEDAKAEIFSPHRATNEAIKDFLGQSEEFKTVFYEFAPLHIGVFGNAWVEHVMNKTRNRIWDFNIADPLSMDFAREAGAFQEGKVILDGLGREWGYRQEASSDGDPDVYFTREEMSHLTLMQLRRGDRGIGFTEMLFGDINLKENVEQSITAQAFASGFPKPLIQSGNERHPNNPALEQAAMRLATDIVDDGIDWAVLPDGLELGKWEVQPIDAVSMEYLNLILKYQASAFGIPLPFLLQSGDVSQNTLEVLMDNFDMMFRAFQKRLQLDKVMTKVLRFNGLPHEDITVQYGRMSERKFKEESLRLHRMLKTEALDVSDSEVKSRIEEIAGIQRPRDPSLPPTNG